jgi:hypothetical protein
LAGACGRTIRLLNPPALVSVGRLSDDGARSAGASPHQLHSNKPILTQIDSNVKRIILTGSNFYESQSCHYGNNEGHNGDRKSHRLELPPMPFKAVARTVIAVIVVAVLAIVVEKYVNVVPAIVIGLIGCGLLIYLHELHRPVFALILNNSAALAPSIEISFAVLGALFVLWARFYVPLSPDALKVPELRWPPPRPPLEAYKHSPPTPAPPRLKSPANNKIPPSQAGVPPLVRGARSRLANDPEHLTLLDLFYTDFSVAIAGMGVVYLDSERRWPLNVSIFTDPVSSSKFLAFYIPLQEPRRGSASGLALLIKEKYQWVLDNAPRNDLTVTTRTPGDSDTITDKEAVFSKRIYVYHENFMPPKDIVALEDEYKRSGLTVDFRGPDYFAYRKEQAIADRLKKLTSRPQ